MLEQEVLNTIIKYNLIESGDSVVLGVSGGPDSICMLNILNNLKENLNFKIYVAHINHMIRKEADEETEYVKEFCERIGVECYIKKEKIEEIAKQNKKGTEETGRKVRYDFFEEVAERVNANKIATAHNNNDKVETIIMNLLRGTGPSGLKGIEPTRDNKFIRPLIETQRQEIEQYCEENKLNPRYDKSNNENTYTRNKIRNIIIPYIKKEFNPNIMKTVNRLSEITTEEQNYLNKITKQEYNKIVITTVGAGLMSVQQDEIILDLKKFNNLELIIKRKIILYAINQLLGTTNGIEKINIDDIILLCDKNIGNKYLMPIPKLKVLVKNKKIFFISNNDLP